MTKPGYIEIRGMIRDIDECKARPAKCNPNQLCRTRVYCVASIYVLKPTDPLYRNNEGSYECICSSGFYAATDDTLASAITASTVVGGAIPDITIGDCIDIDECSTGGYDCFDHATCINTIGSYRCECEIGYYWIGGKCMDIDECIKYSDLCLSDRKRI